MRYTGFLLKLLTLAAIAGTLFRYQSVASARAAVTAENEAKIAAVEAANREIELENARRRASAAAAAGEEAEVLYYYKDGTFEGTGDGYGGPIRVAVTIESDILTEVKVLSHDAEDPAYFVLAEGLTDRILSAQSTDVDAASGATFSSRGIISAVENALKEAVNEQ